jgi:hypothetical protein
MGAERAKRHNPEPIKAPSEPLDASYWKYAHPACELECPPNEDDDVQMAPGQNHVPFVATLLSLLTRRTLYVL